MSYVVKKKCPSCSHEEAHHGDRITDGKRWYQCTECEHFYPDTAHVSWTDYDEHGEKRSEADETDK